MNELTAGYKQSVKESSGVTKLSVGDAFILLKMAFVVSLLLRGHKIPVVVPGLEVEFSPIRAFFLLHAIHFVLGLWALALGSQATTRMESYRYSKQLRVFRDSGTILSSTHAVYGWWRGFTCFCPVLLMAGISNNNPIACSLSFLACLPWMTLWANTVNFREPDVVPVNIFSYLKFPFLILYYAAWIPCVIVKRIVTGDRTPI